MYNVVRGTTTHIDQIPIIDGQMLFDTDKKSIFMDDGGVRKEYSSNIVADPTIDTTSVNAIQNQAVGNAIIDDLATIKVTTEPLKFAGALAVKELDNNVKELNDSLASALITNSYSSATPFVNVVSKRAGIVTINATLIRNTYDMPVNVTIATIPDDFKPRNIMYRVPCALRNPGTGSLSPGYINIYTDGRIIIDGVVTIPSGMREVDINITYVCAT